MLFGITMFFTFVVLHSEYGFGFFFVSLAAFAIYNNVSAFYIVLVNEVTVAGCGVP